MKFLTQSYQSLIAKKREIAASAVLCLMTGQMALAAGGGGLAKTKKFLENIHWYLHGIAISVTVIAIVIVGYKMMFKGASIHDCLHIIIGAGLIAGSVEIATMFFGN